MNLTRFSLDTLPILTKWGWRLVALLVVLTVVIGSVGGCQAWGQCDGDCQEAAFKELAGAGADVAWQHILLRALLIPIGLLIGLAGAVFIFSVLFSKKGHQKMLHAFDEYQLVLNKFTDPDPDPTKRPTMEDAVIGLSCAFSTGMRLLSIALIVSTSLIAAVWTLSKFF